MQAPAEHKSKVIFFAGFTVDNMEVSCMRRKLLSSYEIEWGALEFWVTLLFLVDIYSAYNLLLEVKYTIARQERFRCMQTCEGTKHSFEEENLERKVVQKESSE